MLLAFDVGNTNIVCGVYKDEQLLDHWRIATNTLQTADGYASVLGMLFQLNGLHFNEVEDVIISTVVPPIIPILQTLSRRYFHVNPILVGPGIKTGMNILYDNPKELGSGPHRQCGGGHPQVRRPGHHHRYGHRHHLLRDQ